MKLISILKWLGEREKKPTQLANINNEDVRQAEGTLVKHDTHTRHAPAARSETNHKGLKRKQMGGFSSLICTNLSPSGRCHPFVCVNLFPPHHSGHPTVTPLFFGLACPREEILLALFALFAKQQPTLSPSRVGMPGGGKKNLVHNLNWSRTLRANNSGEGGKNKTNNMSGACIYLYLFRPEDSLLSGMSVEQNKTKKK